jgi:hypothetical protein
LNDKKTRPKKEVLLTPVEDTPLNLRGENQAAIVE